MELATRRIYTTFIAHVPFSSTVTLSLATIVRTHMLKLCRRYRDVFDVPTPISEPSQCRMNIDSAVSRSPPNFLPPTRASSLEPIKPVLCPVSIVLRDSATANTCSLAYIEKRITTIAMILYHNCNSQKLLQPRWISRSTKTSSSSLSKVRL